MKKALNGDLVSKAIKLFCQYKNIEKKLQKMIGEMTSAEYNSYLKRSQ